MNGWVFLGLAALLSVGCFLNGLRFARMTRNPWAGRRLFGMPLRGSDMSVGQVRLLGRFLMIFAAIFLAVAAAVSFGLFGPVKGVEPIGVAGAGR